MLAQTEVPVAGDIGRERKKLMLICFLQINIKLAANDLMVAIIQLESRITWRPTESFGRLSLERLPKTLWGPKSVSSSKIVFRTSIRRTEVIGKLCPGIQGRLAICSE